MHDRLTTFLGTLLVAATVGTSSIAAPVTWYFDNATFQDGTKITGSFDFDADTATYSNVSVLTETGMDSDGASFGGASYTHLFTPGTNTARRFDFLTTATSADNTGAKRLTLTWVSDLTNVGGIVQLNALNSNNNIEGFCDVSTCGNPDPRRLVATGSLTSTFAAPVPLPAGMTLTVSALAGFGVMRMKRKSPAR